MRIGIWHSVRMHSAGAIAAICLSTCFWGIGSSPALAADEEPNPYLAPDELIPSLLLGMGKSCFENERFDEAIAYLEKILADYPKSDSAPEALYLGGVCRYKNTHDPKPLKEAYEQLRDEYPSNEWTKRAYPYRLL